MVLLQSAAFSPQFVYRQLGRVVNKYLGLVQGLGTGFQLLLLPSLQLAAFQLVAGYLGFARYQTHGQLHTGHLQREEGHRLVEIHSHIPCHRQCKCRFTHSWTGSQNNKRSRVETRGDAVQLRKSRRHTHIFAIALVAFLGLFYLVGSGMHQVA